MSALRSNQRGGKSGRSRADDSDSPGRFSRTNGQFGLMAGTWIYEAGTDFARKHMVQTCLVAGDARSDKLRLAAGRLRRKTWIRQKGTGHRDHVRASLGKYRFGHLRRIDAVRGDYRNRHLIHQFLRYPGERAAWNGCRDRRNTGLVPANSGIDDRGPGVLDRTGQRHDLRPTRSLGNEVNHGKPVDDYEPVAHRAAHPSDHLDRQPHPVFVGTTPAIGTPVGAGDKELVEEISLGPHDFHAIIPRLKGPAGRRGHVGDLFFYAVLIEMVGWKRRDRRPHRARSDAVGRVRVAAGVQDLHGDHATLVMDTTRHNAMVGDVSVRIQPGGIRKHPSLPVWRHTSGYNESDAS